jgi:hypothetical protein
MSSKTIVMLGMVIGSTVGGYIPSLFHAGFLSIWGVVGSAIGGLLGIWVTYKYFA